MSDKEDRPTKHILKTLLTLHIQRIRNKQTSHITYVPACMHNNIVIPYDKF